MGPSFLVEANNISFTHPGQMSPLWSNVSFTLQPGKMLCISGINGGGKSTLLNILAGLLLPSSGNLFVHGLSISDLQKTENSNHRRQTAYVQQQADMQIIGNTVAEDMLTGTFSKATPLAVQKQEAYAMAQRFSLDSYWETPVHHLSYGQKKKLCLATALLYKPRLLLLDEPFNGLDYPATLDLLDSMKNLLNQGIAIVITHHDLRIIQELCDFYLFLHPKQPVAIGSAELLFPLALQYGIRPLL